MTIKLIKDAATPSLKKIENFLQSVPSKAHKFFVDSTPRNTGNAKRNTRLQGDTIRAAYPYATDLDKGSSRQAPKGMTKPTSDYVNKLIRQGVKK